MSGVLKRSKGREIFLIFALSQQKLQDNNSDKILNCYRAELNENYK